MQFAQSKSDEVSPPRPTSHIFLKQLLAGANRQTAASTEGVGILFANSPSRLQRLVRNLIGEDFLLGLLQLNGLAHRTASFSFLQRGKNSAMGGRPPAPLK